jgi:hypothetical protein
VHNPEPMFPAHSLARHLRAASLLAALASSIVASGCGSAQDDRPPQWSYIYPAIIQPSCATASCHSDFTRIAGVNFGYSTEAYFQLACRHFVVACPAAGTTDPCTGMAANPAATCTPSTAVMDSQLLYQLRAQGASRMPPDFALPNADIDLIQSWIAAGAQND